jgi:hypothetical protein
MKEKRVWVYTQPPRVYELFCPINNDHEIEWSEWIGYIWCPTCSKDHDVRGQGVFSGPIPVGTCEILGI